MTKNGPTFPTLDVLTSSPPPFSPLFEKVKEVKNTGEFNSPAINLLIKCNNGDIGNEFGPGKGTSSFKKYFLSLETISSHSNYDLDGNNPGSDNRSHLTKKFLRQHNFASKVILRQETCLPCKSR